MAMVEYNFQEKLQKIKNNDPDFYTAQFFGMEISDFKIEVKRFKKIQVLI